MGGVGSTDCHKIRERRSSLTRVRDRDGDARATSGVYLPTSTTAFISRPHSRVGGSFRTVELRPISIMWRTIDAKG
jgi:hypothetical protein